MKTSEVLEAIGTDPELLAAHDSPEFRNLMTHVTQASNGTVAIQMLCLGYLEMVEQALGGPESALASVAAEMPEPTIS
jgi:hypothetical protein